MARFVPEQYDSGKLINLGQVSSKTITKGDALKFVSGYVERATQGVAEVRYIAMEGQVSGAGVNPDILCLPVQGIRFSADTNANPSQALVDTKVDIEDYSELDENDTGIAIFYTEEIVGAVGNKRVRGYFVSDVA